MNKYLLTKKQKEKFASYISNILYRKMMSYWLDGMSMLDIAEHFGYSSRQVERIISQCRELVIVEMMNEFVKE